MNGKLIDVLFVNSTREIGGIKIAETHEFNLYADEGVNEIIRNVEGVLCSFVDNKTHYWLRIDPRYDTEYVKAEIEAAILCREEVNR